MRTLVASHGRRAAPGSLQRVSSRAWTQRLSVTWSSRTVAGTLVRRLIVCSALTLGLALPALVQARVRLPQPIYFWRSTVAAVSVPKGQGPLSNTRVIRPSLIYMFADGSWDIDHLRWTGWGSRVAHARGISSASNGIPSQAQGKRIKRPARVTLSKPGRFQGHEVYRCFRLSVPAAPSTDQHLCLAGHHGFYYLTSTAP
jgi:hypothetical protein